MPQANVIHWRDGSGWLILSGSINPDEDDTSEVEGLALSRIRAGEPIAYIWAAGDIDAADIHLEALQDMGAPTGFLLDVMTEDDDEIRSQLATAGMIILGDGPDRAKLRSGLMGAALEAMDAAFDRGTVIMGIGAGAEVLGTFLEERSGLSWVENAIIATYESGEEPTRLRSLLVSHPESYGLAIGPGSAVAFGPRGEIEAWGNRQVTVMLGRNAVNNSVK